MVASITVTGATQNYTQTGNTVVNTGTFADIHNIATDASNLENFGGIRVDRQFVTTPSATGSSTVAIPQNVDSVNVQGTATIANLTLTFPVPVVSNINPTGTGLWLRFIFDVAITSLTFNAPTGYTVETAGALTSATAGAHITYELVGTVWKPA